MDRFDRGPQLATPRAGAFESRRHAAGRTVAHDELLGARDRGIPEPRQALLDRGRWRRAATTRCASRRPLIARGRSGARRATIEATGGTCPEAWVHRPRVAEDLLANPLRRQAEAEHRCPGDDEVRLGEVVGGHLVGRIRRGRPGRGPSAIAWATARAFPHSGFGRRRWRACAAPFKVRGLCRCPHRSREEDQKVPAGDADEQDKTGDQRPARLPDP